MGIFEELFDGLAMALDVTPVRTIGHEYDPEKASDAWNLLHNVAVDCNSLQYANESGMFPRIKVQEIQDLQLIMQAMNAYGRQMNEDLVRNVAGYAMGGTEFTWDELREQAAEYHRGMVLGRALRKAEIDMKQEAQERQEAKLRANSAYGKMDAVSAYPPEFIDFSAMTVASLTQLVEIAKHDTAVLTQIGNGDKLKAIKTLRIVASCSLGEAKSAIDKIMD